MGSTTGPTPNAYSVPEQMQVTLRLPESPSLPNTEVLQPEDPIEFHKRVCFLGPYNTRGEAKGRIEEPERPTSLILKFLIPTSYLTSF